MSLRRVSVFGATGSIGQSTLDLIGRAPDHYNVVALTAGRNVAQLAEDARRFKAEVAVISDESLLPELRLALQGCSTEAAAGVLALNEAASRPVDWVMSAIVGAAGLEPGLKALEQGATLALANKESLVTAGKLLLKTAAENGARVLPVDSEHSAVFQALVGEDISAVERVIITASGGAFRDWPVERLKQATVAQASSHPNWDMGQRITIDSASMFNKALEVIETHEYFGFLPDQIEVLIHPQSLVHALVGFQDGGLMAHLGAPDMRHAIGYALHYPMREKLPVARLDLAEIGQLDFAAPDIERYPALALANTVMERGGLSGAVFNVAKDAALDAFIAGQIGFTQMSDVVEEVLDLLLPDNGLIDAPMNLDNLRHATQLGQSTTAQVMRATKAI